MISFVCFQWNIGFREYLPKRVNKLAAQVAKHFPDPHRFICVTDETEGFDVEVMPLPEAARAVADIPSPEGRGFPSSYRRLWAFSDEARCLGERIMMLDVDCMIVGDLRPLFEPQDDFVGWRPRSVWGTNQRIGGGTWLLRTGTHAWVWDEFVADPPKMIAETKAAGWRGSDQAYMSHRLSATCAVWPQDAGIYQSQDGVKRWYRLPPDARIVHFNGNVKNWHPQARRVPWLARMERRSGN